MCSSSSFYKSDIPLFINEIQFFNKHLNFLHFKSQLASLAKKKISAQEI